MGQPVGECGSPVGRLAAPRLGAKRCCLGHLCASIVAAAAPAAQGLLFPARWGPSRFKSLRDQKPAGVRVLVSEFTGCS
jgi:hypothetical protein